MKYIYLIFILSVSLWGCKNVVSPDENINTMLAVGNKWFYKNYSFNNDKWYYDTSHVYPDQLEKDSAFVVREVIEANSDGNYIISVKHILQDTIITKKEHWQYINGDIYIKEYSGHPLYISSLLQDSTNGGYSWHLSDLNLFGLELNTQSYRGEIYPTNGGIVQIIQIAEGVGIVYSYKYSLLLSHRAKDSTYIIGMKLGNIFWGDSISTIY